MDNRFEHIDMKNEKVYKIVNSAFEVFSKNDLEKASTNMVVKQAGISRGLLYHYFKDKQELFDFLLYFSIKESITGLDEKINWEDSDFINRLRQVIIIKLEHIQRYPYMMEFYDKYANKLTKSFINQHVETISPGIRERIYSYNIDFSLVKESIDFEKMVNVIKLTLKGIIEEYLEMVRARNEKFEADVIIDKCDEYFTFFREQFFI